MARTNATNFSGALQFPYATAGTDIFRKEDVQTLAQAVDQHDHSSGKGLVVNTAALPAGSIAGSALADGGVTSAKIADGTIVAADIANATITNAKLASDTARANLLTNGGLEIWQRGNGPFTAGNAWTADRWGIGLSGTDTISVSKDTTNKDTASGSLACMAVTVTHGTGTNTAINQYLNSADGYQLAGQAVSMSARIRTSVANAVRVRLSGNISTTAYSSFHPGDGTYRTLTVTTTLGASESGVYACIELDASCTAYVDNTMLVVGSQAADYAPLHPADDLARCLRYYEGLQLKPWSSYGAAGQSAGLPIFYGVKKAVAPTLTKATAWSQSNVTSSNLGYNHTDGFNLSATVTATGAFSVGPAGGNDITIEANP